MFQRVARLFLVATIFFRCGRGGDFASLELTKIWIKGTVASVGQEGYGPATLWEAVAFEGLKFSAASCRFRWGRRSRNASGA
jgi:hypothetical protein